MKRPSYGFILLAAGGSTRMGKPKALLPYHGKTLLEHAAAAVIALEETCGVIVTGAHHDMIQETCPLLAGKLVFNPDWRDGMSSSIRAGLNALKEKHFELQGFFILVCDQPFISPALLKEMILLKQQLRKPIVACRYGDTWGVPVLFGNEYRDHMVALTGDRGAKSLLISYPEEVAAIDFEQGAVDIDTPNDYARLLTLSIS